MKEKVPHKWQEKMELTYEQYAAQMHRLTVELARELEHVLGREKALEVISKASERMAVKRVRQKIENFDDFKTFFKAQGADPLSSHALTFTILEETPKKLALHITECLWAKTFKEMNATDLGYVMLCHPDFAAAQAIHPKIKLRRTKTLMQGDSHCDHTWHWEE